MLDLLKLIRMDLVYPATILFMPYLTFIFCGEQVNPFHKSTVPSRRLRWQFGKRMAYTMLLATLIANALLHLGGLDPLVSFSVGGVFFTVVGLFLYIKRIIFINSLQ